MGGGGRRRNLMTIKWHPSETHELFPCRRLQICSICACRNDPGIWAPGPLISWPRCRPTGRLRIALRPLWYNLRAGTKQCVLYKYLQNNSLTSSLFLTKFSAAKESVRERKKCENLRCGIYTARTRGKKAYSKIKFKSNTVTLAGAEIYRNSRFDARGEPWEVKYSKQVCGARTRP